MVTRNMKEALVKPGGKSQTPVSRYQNAASPFEINRELLISLNSSNKTDTSRPHNFALPNNFNAGY